MAVPTLLPDAAPWPRAKPEAAGFDAEKLAAAVAFAEAHESPGRRDLRAQLEAGHFEPPPDNEIIGPVAPESMQGYGGDQAAAAIGR